MTRTIILLYAALILVLCSLLVVKPSRGDTEAYCWETTDHVFSCTDDLEMVPPMYGAYVATLDGLADYPKLTVSGPERLVSERRLNHLRAQNEECIQRPRPVSLEYARPMTVAREMRWIEGHLGYSGARYVAVDVLRDADGREIMVTLPEAGFPFTEE